MWTWQTQGKRKTCWCNMGNLTHPTMCLTWQTHGWDPSDQAPQQTSGRTLQPVLSFHAHTHTGTPAHTHTRTNTHTHTAASVSFWEEREGSSHTQTYTHTHTPRRPCRQLACVGSLCRQLVCVCVCVCVCEGVWVVEGVRDGERG